MTCLNGHSSTDHLSLCFLDVDVPGCSVLRRTLRDTAKKARIMKELGHGAHTLETIQEVPSPAAPTAVFAIVAWETSRTSRQSAGFTVQISTGTESVTMRGLFPPIVRDHPGLKESVGVYPTVRDFNCCFTPDLTCSTVPRRDLRGPQEPCLVGSCLDRRTSQPPTVGVPSRWRTEAQHHQRRGYRAARKYAATFRRQHWGARVFCLLHVLWVSSMREPNMAREA